MTKSLSTEVFQARRQTLLSQLKPGDIVILPAAPECLRNGDAYYRYRQNSDFYYLTGFPEAAAVAIFMPGREAGEYILFNQPRDPQAEIWVGSRVGQQQACEVYGASQAFPIDTLDEMLVQWLSGCHRVYYSLGQHPTLDKQLLMHLNGLRAKIRRGVNIPYEIRDLEPLLHTMRLIKTVDEINIMRHVAALSAKAHVSVMQACKPGMMEYQLEALLLQAFYHEGCGAPAYDSIVAGGERACILHYTANNQPLKDGELVLVDAGGEYQYYAADITRTFPVSGQFTSQQRAIYEIVLRAQAAGIALVRPKTPWPDIQATVIHVLTSGLVDVGLLKGRVSDLVEQKAYLPFYMHNAGHWLGMDVHDVGSYKVEGQWRALSPGMVLTVEPGIYIKPSAEVDRQWWGIGIRIEDDILVTETHHENLTDGAPKTIDDIEAVMR